MAVDEQASRDATSKAPVLVYSVNQDGWPASSPIVPPPPPRLAAAALMPQPPPLTAERGEFRHRAVAAAVAVAAATASAAWYRKGVSPDWVSPSVQVNVNHCARCVFLSHATNTRAPHFTPQHWLLCHMGLY